MMCSRILPTVYDSKCMGKCRIGDGGWVYSGHRVVEGRAVARVEVEDVYNRDWEGV